MIDCVQHSTSVLNDLWNPNENNLKKSMSQFFSEFHGSVLNMSSRGNLCKLSRTLKMYNTQFIQFARIPVEFVACLQDMSTQKYQNFP